MRREGGEGDRREGEGGSGWKEGWSEGRERGGKEEGGGREG